MPQMQHADRVRSALADTWPDQTSTPAVPASAPSILPPASSAEPCRLPSQQLHGQGRCIQPRDARDREPRARPQPPVQNAVNNRDNLLAKSRLADAAQTEKADLSL